MENVAGSAMAATIPDSMQTMIRHATILCMEKPPVSSFWGIIVQNAHFYHPLQTGQKEKAAEIRGCQKHPDYLFL